MLALVLLATFMAAFEFGKLIGYGWKAFVTRPRRVRAEFGAAYVSFVSRIREKLPSEFSLQLKRQLALAGQPKGLDGDAFISLKVLLTLGGLAFSLLVGAVVWPKIGNWLLFALVVMGLCFFAPDIWLRRRIAYRQHRIKLDLPDVLDVLTISVEAGLSFDAALGKVTAQGDGPLAEEFSRLLKEIQLGSSRREAFHSLSKRTSVPELDSFILAMLQADVFGISIAKVLRVGAGEMRVRRRQQAEEVAMKAPVKVVFPLVFCIFPALLVVILGPAAIKIYQSLARF